MAIVVSTIRIRAWFIVAMKTTTMFRDASQYFISWIISVAINCQKELVIHSLPLYFIIYLFTLLFFHFYIIQILLRLHLWKKLNCHPHIHKNIYNIYIHIYVFIYVFYECIGMVFYFFNLFFLVVIFSMMKKKNVVPIWKT